MKKLLTFALVVFVLFFSSVYTQMARADRAVASPALVSNVVVGDMTENALLNVSFNSVESNIDAIKPKFDKQVTEIEKLAKDAGITAFELQSKNYNINSQNYNAMNSGFRFNGNLSYKVSPTSKAAELMAALIKKGYQANVNVNTYHRGGAYCPQNRSVMKSR